MKKEIGWSSAGDFMVQDFHDDDPVARQAAVFWKRRIVDIPFETNDRWHDVSKAYFAMLEEQRALYRSTVPFTEDSLVLTYQEPQ